MSATKTLPPRSDVPPADTWDLASLFAADADWEKAFAEWEGRIDGYARFRGHLGAGPEELAACLCFDADFERLGDRVATYAFLKESEDTANGTYQAMKGRVRATAARAHRAASYLP